MKLVLLFSCVGTLEAANVRSKTAVSRKRFFPIMIGDDLHMLSSPSRDSKLLRGSALDFEPILEDSLPSMVVPLAELSPEAAEDTEVAPVSVDGPLRDLVDFGSAIGAAVLPRVVHGSPLELPMDILHVKMQQEVPKPLNVDDTPSKVHIYGNLPKNLTAKTLQVSSEGRNLVVKYFIDEGKQAGNSIVGIDERFALDFEPVVTPAVRYKASTGAFEMILPRPPKETSQRQVNIEFDVSQPEVPSKKIVAQTRSGPVTAPLQKVVSKPTPEFSKRVSQSTAPVQRSSLKADDHDVKTLAKMTRQLREAGQTQQSVGGRDDRAKRAQEIADKAKRFVAEARLGDAKAELQNAFAPQIFEGEGMVLLELNHKSL
jgi:hypothetical protein|mmetsp:Transcript_102640/g.162177  ORF Transcript_102640/g.162177 Transcript_102640/m.162177 type:complete len:372 (-) Transcript_102640:60-1175(-)|eukprot:CAMPEP_0169100824 /NCGR_PEP_ID=MMETSP1015-20121227/21298_1 /TAXON_ID=342587 /ORGANISM="Karlodinium micrum, Strain CCMP2283" /LENGTH=371 /DNA_ID=CAMNT_0009161801 /DNA_START=84 /DNA_END=1199 /DNA_ORIENTATION=+